MCLWASLRTRSASCPAIPPVSSGVDEDEDPILAEDVEGVVDVLLAHRAVRAERDHDEPGELVRLLELLQQRQRLRVLATAVRVRAKADVGEIVEREQHRRVADRERRPAEVRIGVRVLLLDPSARRFGGRRGQGEDRDGGRHRPSDHGNTLASNFTNSFTPCGFGCTRSP